MFNRHPIAERRLEPHLAHHPALVHLCDVPPEMTSPDWATPPESFFSPSQPTSRGINWGVAP
jgi:hypothetical protein